MLTFILFFYGKYRMFCLSFFPSHSSNYFHNLRDNFRSYFLDEDGAHTQTDENDEIVFFFCFKTILAAVNVNERTSIFRKG